MIQVAEIEILIVRAITQVKKGTHYKGTLQIASTEFAYEIKFVPTIPDLLCRDIPCADEDDLLRCIPIEMTKDDVQVELSFDEYFFFFQLLTDFVMDYYENPLLQGSQQDDSSGLFAVFDESAPAAKFVVGMMNVCSVTFPIELREMLSAPKFGCTFPD